MRCAHVLLTTSVALGMAACSQNSPSMSERVSNVTATSSVAQDTNATTNMSDFERSAAQKPVPVVVEGSAFGLDQAALERQIADDMKGGYWVRRANFIPASQARTMPGEPDYLVVMRLSPTGEPQVTGQQLCADQYRVGSADPSTNMGVSTNASAAPSPARGSTNPAMRNDSADISRLAAADPEERYRNYNLSAPSATRSSTRNDAAAAVARQNQVNSSNASTTVSRGSTNPAMRNDSAATENRPAAIGPEDRLRKPEAGTASSSSSAAGSTMGSSGVAAGPGRSAATSTGPRSTAAGRGSVHLVSALCRDAQAVRAVDTRATNLSGPGDQAFHNLIVNATNQLTQPMPSESPAEPGQER